MDGYSKINLNKDLGDLPLHLELTHRYTNIDEEFVITLVAPVVESLLRNNSVQFNEEARRMLSRDPKDNTFLNLSEDGFIRELSSVLIRDADNIAVDTITP